MPGEITSARRHERRSGQGITQRHAETCGLSHGKRRCTCTPVFRIEVSTGARGERRRVRETFSTEADATARVEELKRLTRNGADIEATPPPRTAVPTMREAASAFTARMASGDARGRGARRYSDSTIDNYCLSLDRHVLPFLVERHGCEMGDLPADSIDTRLIEEMGHRLGAKSPETARRAQGVLRTVLADLYRRGILDRIPEAPLDRPAPAKPKDRRLSVEEAQTIIGAAFADDAAHGRSLMGPLVTLLARTGLRRKEIIGLRWGTGGIDLTGDAPTLSVGRATTKTDAGERVLALDADTAQVLRVHRLAVGRPDDGGLVFTHPDQPEAPVSIHMIRAAFKRIEKATGIPHLGPHLFRHCVASWAIESGADAVDVAARLGHSDGGRLLMRQYAHANRDRIAREPLDLGWAREDRGA